MEEIVEHLLQHQNFSFSCTCYIGISLANIRSCIPKLQFIIHENNSLDDQDLELKATSLQVIHQIHLGPALSYPAYQRAFW